MLTLRGLTLPSRLRSSRRSWSTLRLRLTASAPGSGLSRGARRPRRGSPERDPDAGLCVRRLLGRLFLR